MNRQGAKDAKRTHRTHERHSPQRHRGHRGTNGDVPQRARRAQRTDERMDHEGRNGRTDGRNLFGARTKERTGGSAGCADSRSAAAEGRGCFAFPVPRSSPGGRWMLDVGCSFRSRSSLCVLRAAVVIMEPVGAMRAIRRRPFSFPFVPVGVRCPCASWRSWRLGGSSFRINRRPVVPPRAAAVRVPTSRRRVSPSSRGAPRAPSSARRAPRSSARPRRTPPGSPPPRG